MVVFGVHSQIHQIRAGAFSQRHPLRDGCRERAQY